MNDHDNTGVDRVVVRDKANNKRSLENDGSNPPKVPTTGDAPAETDNNNNDNVEDFTADLLDMNDDEQLRFLAKRLEEIEQGGLDQADANAERDEDSEIIARDADVDGERTEVGDNAVIIRGPAKEDGEDSREPDQSHEPEPVVLSEQTFDVSQNLHNLPFTEIRRNSLPLLDNISTQLLQWVGGGHYQEVLDMITRPESEKGQAFHVILSLFEQAKKIYCGEDESFISISALERSVCPLKEHRAVIQRTNLVTFACAVFGSLQVGFYDLNEYFLDAFVPENSRILKAQGALYLDLKTQAYISGMSQGLDKSQQEVLRDLFPDDMEKIFLERRSYSKIPANSTTSAGETDFIARCTRRKENLMSIDPKDVDALQEQYSWLSFLKDLSDYLSKNLKSIVSGDALTISNPEIIKAHSTNSASKIRVEVPLNSENGSFHVWSTNPPTEELSNKRKPADNPSVTSTDAREVTPSASSPVVAQDIASAYGAIRQSVLENGLPITELNTKGLSFQRRPWTKAEEEALMKGLDRVQGPHWSQILELYGAGGTISEVLKDRNQVQLKDKARNLKMFFMKCGAPIPPALQFVTGDMKRILRKRGANANVSRGDSGHEDKKLKARAAAVAASVGNHSNNMPSVNGSESLQSASGYDDHQRQSPVNNHHHDMRIDPDTSIDPALELHNTSTNNDRENAKQERESHIEKLIESVGEYINNQQQESNHS